MAESIRAFLLDSIAQNNNSLENLEIEAKFGLIIDNGTSQRIQLPVYSECVINHQGWTNFVSDMPLNLHKIFNEELNKRFAIPSLGWKYLHTKTVDHILPNRTRITIDSAGNIVNAQVKQKLGNLSIFQPNCIMDIRLSVNVEIPVPVEGIHDDLSKSAIIKRKKDRVAYEIANGLLSVDLTQVAQNGGNGSQLKHELELEVKDPKSLMNSPEALQAFVDSIRELSQLIK